MKILKNTEVYTSLLTSHKEAVQALIERFNTEVLKTYLAESYAYSQVFFRIDDIIQDTLNRQAIHIFRKELEKYWNVEALDIKQSVLENGEMHKYLRITFNH